MYCPLCAQALTPVERQGIEIDYCVHCGGMWLDNGELTELIRREALAAVAVGQNALTEQRRDREFDRVADTADTNHFALSRGVNRSVEVTVR